MCQLIFRSFRIEHITFFRYFFKSIYYIDSLCCTFHMTKCRLLIQLFYWPCVRPNSRLGVCPSVLPLASQSVLLILFCLPHCLFICIYIVRLTAPYTYLHIKYRYFCFLLYLSASICIVKLCVYVFYKIVFFLLDVSVCYNVFCDFISVRYFRSRKLKAHITTGIFAFRYTHTLTQCRPFVKCVCGVVAFLVFVIHIFLGAEVCVTVYFRQMISVYKC